MVVNPCYNNFLTCVCVCVCRYSGAMCGLALVFVFPSAVHLKALKRSGELRWPSACFHIFLIVLGVANLLAQFFM